MVVVVVVVVAEGATGYWEGGEFMEGVHDACWEESTLHGDAVSGF